MQVDGGAAPLRLAAARPGTAVNLQMDNCNQFRVRNIPVRQRQTTSGTFLYEAIRGLIQIDALYAEDMATALREEYATDAKGRRYRVNHAVRVTKTGVQHTFWAMMKNAPRQHMQKAFIQRREQIVGDCVQPATDVEAYNEMKSDQPSTPMLFDFRDDVEERRYWDDKKAA